LLLYFTFFILVYNSYKNFTYIIGLVILITFKIFNIDTTLNGSSINLINTFTNVKVENFNIMNAIRKETDIRISNLKTDIDSDANVPQSNPAKSYIVDAVQRAGLTISSNQFNYKNQEKEAESKLNNMLAGHRDVKPPANISFNRSV
jgi:hypothetical protein